MGWTQPIFCIHIGSPSGRPTEFWWPAGAIMKMKISTLMCACLVWPKLESESKTSYPDG